MKISRLLKITIFLSLLFLLASCGKEFNPLDEQLSEDTEKEEILAYLESLDYVLDSVTFKADMVFYESDMGWRKEHLLKRSRGEYEYMEIESPEPLDASLASDRQRAIPEEDMADALTRQNAGNITYYIRSSIGFYVHLAWVGGITSAAAEWNNLSNCRVNFIRVFNENAADIVFVTDNENDIPAGLQNLSFSTIAATNLPSNGDVPGFIAINNLWNWHWKMKTVIMHEMGHTLGFHHTGSSAGDEVFLTPTYQSNSVMNPSAGSASSTFQSGDIRMARLFYPNSLPQPTNFAAYRTQSGQVTVTYENPDVINSPYYWIRMTKYTPAGQILAERFIQSATASNGVHSAIWGGHGTGQMRFAVRGFNFKRDVFSSRTDRVLVSL